MSEKLPNPLNNPIGTPSKSSDDFLAFSASSTPREDRFQPKRGKANRQDNWKRFGQFERGRGGGSPRGGRGGYQERFYSPAHSRGSPSKINILRK